MHATGASVHLSLGCLGRGPLTELARLRILSGNWSVRWENGEEREPPVLLLPGLVQQQCRVAGCPESRWSAPLPHCTFPPPSTAPPVAHKGSLVQEHGCRRSGSPCRPTGSFCELQPLRRYFLCLMPTVATSLTVDSSRVIASFGRQTLTSRGLSVSLLGVFSQIFPRGSFSFYIFSSCLYIGLFCSPATIQGASGASRLRASLTAPTWHLPSSSHLLFFEHLLCPRHCLKSLICTELIVSSHSLMRYGHCFYSTEQWGHWSLVRSFLKSQAANVCGGWSLTQICPPRLCTGLSYCIALLIFGWVEGEWMDERMNEHVRERSSPPSHPQLRKAAWPQRGSSHAPSEPALSEGHIMSVLPPLPTRVPMGTTLLSHQQPTSAPPISGHTHPGWGSLSWISAYGGLCCHCLVFHQEEGSCSGIETWRKMGWDQISILSQADSPPSLQAFVILAAGTECWHGALAFIWIIISEAIVKSA